MHGHQEVSSGFHLQARHHVTGLNLGRESIEHLIDGIPCHKNAVALDPLAQKVLFTAMRVGHQHRAAVVNNAPVDFLGHSIVVASVPGFHVIDWNAHARCDNRCQTTIGVT